MGKATLSYPFEKCMLAAESLATSDAPLRGRLENAYISSLIRLSAPDIRKQMPAEARAPFDELEKRLEAVDDPELGSVHASLRAASDEEVREIADLAWQVISSVVWNFDD